MIFATKLKLVLMTAVSLGAVVCLTVGVAWALGMKQGVPPRDDALPPTVTETPKVDRDKEPSPRKTQLHGVVVDGAGRPVAGAEVLAEAFTPIEARGVTGADGSFAITNPRRRVDGVALLAALRHWQSGRAFPVRLQPDQGGVRGPGTDRREARS